MLSKFKRNKHQQHLAQLPKLPQNSADFKTLFTPADFRQTLLEQISSAKQRICVVALYLENDDAGRSVMAALHAAKRSLPELEISVVVDWHRAQRGRIGSSATTTNADWYCELAEKNSDIAIPVYGVPVNTREALGVLHLKGFIIDDTLFYSGASINDVYLHQHNRYRYDRYHLIHNPQLANIMLTWIENNLKMAKAVHRLDRFMRPKSPEIKNVTRQLRQKLRGLDYQFTGKATNNELAVTPLMGLGKKSLLNKTISNLIPSAEKKLTLCTPYFNLPAGLVRNIIYLLRQGKEVEIIIGDKTANDFYIPQGEPFKIIGALPYLYEINLRRFLSRLQYYITSGHLTLRLWKDAEHSFHLKGIWVDNEWVLLTGNNLNPRAWRLDLENGVLIHDPQQQLSAQCEQELGIIRKHTIVVKHFREVENIADYPLRVKKLIRRLRRIRIDKLINRIL